MTDAVARVMFVVTLLLVIPTLGYLYLSSRPSPDKGQVVAQFEDAFPLIEGMNVRVGGAVAGSVGRINVSDDGLAEVMLVLDEGVARPRADATASIRQQDTTGDSYVAFAPGRSRDPLKKVDGRPTIECSGGGSQRCPRTLVAPRLDDLLNAFGPAERTGIKLTLQELSRAVDGRGRDLNRAALDLRPGLVAANRALADVNTQNKALRDVIGDAEAVTGQAADRRRALARSIEALEATLDVTAAETSSLDQGLRRLPATVRRGRSTMASLRRTATAARPLAVEVRDGAPQLATAVRRAPGFLGDLRSFLVRARPTLQLTHRLLRAAGPTIEAGPTRVVTGAFDLAPAISNLLRGVLGEDETIEVLFNEKFGLGAASAEPGNQPGYPAEHADRRFMRVTAILNCEGFGGEIKPGCLVDLLNLARARAARSGGDRNRRTATRKPADRGAGGAAPGAPRPTAPAPAAGAPAPAPSNPAPTAPAQPTGPAPAPSAPDGQTIKNLLDYLLK
ncbi:MAG TPA: MlaD family protein [Thermoleophilaceae bacterium]|nr:MlaD family protein [Thermoleophilaceae bacterium]